MHHKGTIEFEKENYELAKQDRKDADKNMVMGQSDLAAFLKQRREQMANKEGEGSEGGEGKSQNEINEEMLMDMCKFSNMSTANNLKMCSGNGIIERKNGGGL